MVAWTLTLLMSVGYLLSALPKLTRAPSAIAIFEAFGYSAIFNLFVGIWEATGAFLLLWPRSARWAATALVVLMVGAIYTHLSTGLGSPFHASRGIVILGTIVGLRWFGERHADRNEPETRPRA